MIIQTLLDFLGLKKRHQLQKSIIKNNLKS